MLTFLARRSWAAMKKVDLLNIGCATKAESRFRCWGRKKYLLIPLPGPAASRSTPFTPALAIAVSYVCLTPIPTRLQASEAGDRARHDEVFYEAAIEISNEVDVLVLAQGPLAHLRDMLAAQLKCSLLPSPPLLRREIARPSAQ